MCEYCRRENVKPIHENFEFNIELDTFDNELQVSLITDGYYGNNYTTQAKINYCPMCGRNLWED